MAYIEVRNVSKTIKGVPILQDINLAIEQGTITGFVGANGSGKTMFFRALLGFIKTEGQITIAGQAVKLNTELPVNTGTIIETPGFIENFTGLENLQYLAAIKNTTTKEQIISAMKVFGLEQKANLKVKKYSLGMRQKLAIIQAFMEDQELLVLDEPTNGLDDAAVTLFQKQMKALASEGKTIIIASHDKETIRTLADTIYHVNDGKITKES